MTYTALHNAVWFGNELVCRASSETYAKAIAQALTEWQAK